MVRIRRREEAALTALHGACAQRVFACAMGVLRLPELADEVVSVCFMQAWRDAAEFDECRSGVITWLNTIARSRAIDLLRRNSSRAQHESPMGEDDLPANLDPSADPSAALGLRQLKRRVLTALVGLSPVQRQVLTLAFLGGLSHEEVAAHLVLPVGTVKSHARRGMAELRRQGALRDMAS